MEEGSGGEDVEGEVKRGGIVWNFEWGLRH